MSILIKKLFILVKLTKKIPVSLYENKWIR